MAFEDLVDKAAEKSAKYRDRLIAIYIGLLAVVLAISSVGGGNASKDAMTANIEAGNTWAFFQAKNIRRHEVRLKVDDLELKLATEPDLPESARQAISDRIAEYKQAEAHLSSEPETGEGLKELLVKGKELEARRDLAMRQDPYFDYGQALLQIAIVLASVAIITGGTTILALSGVLGVLGGLFTINGFTLAFAVPYIG